MVGKSSPITGRPLKAHKVMKPQHTRRIIRNHHILMKKKASLESQLKRTNDSNEVSKLKNEIKSISENINQNGGLDKYQQASIAGQSNNRGGDSSKILIEWLDELSKEELREDVKQHHTLSNLTMLEVGCLSVKNACSQSNYFKHIERIDLNSQDPQIKQEDFMKRPLPKNEDETFDILSLSLVLNFVPENQTRGEMLFRTTKFLKQVTTTTTISPSFLPSLFFVLPSPCINNSRYLTEERLLQILTTLGYQLTKRKEAKKVIYWLLTLKHPQLTQTQFTNLKGKFKKNLLNDGKNRNNFSVTI